VRPVTLAGTAASLTVGALLLVACGDGGDGGGGLASPTADRGAGTSLTVEAHDIEFDRETYRVDAGPVRVEYLEKGALPHSLVIEASGGDDVPGFKLEVGDVDADEGTVDLPSGDYVIYCDVPGHRDAGMEAELHVE
jgi:uncharacterized cupredoxin-like copper-binding protein